MKEAPRSLREWTVAAGIVRHDGAVLMVRNRRKNGSLDWSTPGGVVESGEEIVSALTREVSEETGIAVSQWSPARYSVVAVAPGMGWQLNVSVFEALEWSGEIFIDDPDGIVEEAVFVAPEAALQSLSGAARWVAEPITEWLTEPWQGHRQYGYELCGTDRASITVERHQ
jgi:8-oxo-dGTP diphosphatase